MQPVDVKVIRISTAEYPLWQTYVDTHPEATIYHDLAWKTIFEQSFGYRSWYLLAREAESGTIVGCLPLFLVTAPWSRRLVAVPFRDRGGILWSTPQAFNALVEEAKLLLRKTHSAFIEIKSQNAYPADLLTANNLSERWYWVDSCLKLSGMDVNSFRQKIGFKVRNKITQAEKAGLHFIELNHQANDLELWYRLHLKTQKRLGLPPFPKKFFSTMFEQLFSINVIRLFAVTQSEIPAAAAILLLDKKKGIYAYSASDTTLIGFRPNDFLVYNIIQWLLTHGYGKFDMGSDSPMQDSLLEFKSKWLTTQTTVPIYSWGKTDPVVADSSAPLYVFLRKIYQYMPDICIKLTSRQIVRLFG